MTRRRNKHLGDADNEDSAVKPGEVEVPGATPPASDPSTPILRSEDNEEMVDEDSPTWPAGALAMRGLSFRRMIWAEDLPERRQSYNSYPSLRPRAVRPAQAKTRCGVPPFCPLCVHFR